MYRKRHEDLVQFFKMERGLVACTDIDGLMQTLNHNPLDWRLLIDLSKLSLKNMKILMEAINYDKFKWQICRDLKWLSQYLDYNKDSQNIARSFVNGTAELGLFITQERIGLPENPWEHES